MSRLSLRQMPVPNSEHEPTLSPGRVIGQMRVQTLPHAVAGLAAVSGTVTEASSFSGER